MLKGDYGAWADEMADFIGTREVVMKHPYEWMIMPPIHEGDLVTIDEDGMVKRAVIKRAT